jgi:hypothetical protein
MKTLSLSLITTFLTLGCANAQQPQEAAKNRNSPLRVLTISGDWKSQAWYQDIWMQGKGENGKGSNVTYRGRFIAREVEKAAPGQFQFTDITNYIGQQYGDADYFSQFDVILIGDVVGWSMPDRFLQGLKQYVQNGGGFAYLASYKWHTTLLNDTPFEEILPAKFNISGFANDWKNSAYRLDEKNFKPQVALDTHPVAKGLDWTSIPNLDTGFKIIPKSGAQVVLKTPSGAPLLATWDFGKGRTALSASIFANDEVSSQIGNWRDFGKYYAQFLSWLGANSTRKNVTLANATAEATISINGNGPAKNYISAKLFSIHASHDNPDLPNVGETKKNFDALNLKGGFSRLGGFANSVERVNDNDDPNSFNWSAYKFDDIDRQLAEIKRLELEPIVLFEINYGNPEWMWKGTNSNWDNPSDKAIAELGELVAAVVEHANGGKGGDPNYKLNVRYIELANEPDLNPKTIPAFAKLLKAVAKRIHRDYPGVQIGTFGSYEVPYLKQFLEAVNPDMDWVSRHPYGWTGERLFELQDEIRSFQKAKGYREIPFIITEWDFWIEGRPKFDYMMTRYFEAAKRDNLLGTLHYRLGQYAEPVYLFGVLWVGWGQERGAGTKSTPMHDAYDAFYLFRNFRGNRIPVEKVIAGDTPPKLLDHLYADGDKLNAVIYSDWADDGNGFKDYKRGIHYSKTRVKMRFTLPPSTRVRSLIITRATGKGFETVGPPSISLLIKSQSNRQLKFHHYQV